MESLSLAELQVLYKGAIPKGEQASNTFELWLEVRDKCRTDLYFLAKDILGCDLVEGTHRAVCDLFVKKDNTKSIICQDQVKFRLLLYPRGSYKTTLDRIDAVQWHLNWPDCRVGLFSATYDFAVDELLNPIREYFVVREGKPTFFQKLFPEYCVGENSVTNDNGWVSPARKKYNGTPTFYANSLDAGVSGRHFEVMKCDDCVSNKNSRTADQLQKTIDGFNTSKPMVTSINGYLDLIGTRYHLADLYGHFLSNYDVSDMKTLIKPAIKLKPNAVTKPPNEWTPEDVEWLLFEQGLPLKTLKREAKDQRSFACQYLNDPVAAAASPFVRDLLEARTVDWKQVPSKLMYYIAWDFAYSVRAGRDYTVGMVGGLDEQGRLFVIDMYRARYQYSELAWKIADSYRQFKPQLVVIENSNGADFLTGEIKRSGQSMGVQDMSLDFFKVNNGKGAKDSRINSLQALLKSGRLYFLNTIQDIEQLYKEFCEFPGSAHNDIPDAVSHLVRVMPVTPTVPEQAQIFNEVYKELKRKRHLELIFGGSEKTGAFDPNMVEEPIQQGPSDFDAADPFGFPERVV